MFVNAPGNLIGIQDAELDTPVYRTYSENRFTHLLANGTDALVSPSKWDDPFENFFLERTQVEVSTGEHASLKGLAADW